jgi:hypothetical protein
MANAIGTGVNVPDFRHVTHHSLFQVKLESNILYVDNIIRIKTGVVESILLLGNVCTFSFAVSQTMKNYG